MALPLNPAQKNAAEAPKKPLLIVAGAGTGKTRTLLARLSYLIENGAPAESICAITFTNKAAREMAERVANGKERMANGATDGTTNDRPFAIRSLPPYIGTFHSLGARILRAEARFAGRSPNFVIFDEHDAFQVIKKIYKTADEDVRGEKPTAFLGKISEIKNGVLSIERLRAREGARGEMILGMLRRYEAELAKNNAFDFDDLIEKVAAVWKKNPAVLQKYQRRFRHVLVDEYQDINNAQYEFIRLLAAPAETLSVVGDDQQTIYSWRGSNFDIFLNFENDWPGARVVLLEENYRSSKNIIAAASALIQQNQKQKPKTLWTENPPGPPITIAETGSEEEEAAWISDEIQNSLIHKSCGGQAKIKNQNNGVAILYRTNAQSRALEEALLAREIPYIIFGGIKFYERREIKDIVAALRYASNPQDAVSAERLLKTFRKSMWAELKAALDLRRETSPLAIVKLFLKTTDYFEYLDKNFLNADERRENIGELIHFASQFTELPAFLEHVSLLQATDNLATGGLQLATGDAQGANDQKPESGSQKPVNLMTIHLAKGLEFDNVFIAGCTEGILPHARSMDSDAQMEEERRLMYVAMTRAKQELSISFYDQPSRFLSEIPTELTKFESLVSNQTVFADDEERYIELD